MSDLIKREDAIEALSEVFAECEPCDKEEAIDIAVTTVKEIPSADRPQGKWMRTGRTNIYGGIEVQCSNCNDKVMVQHLEDEWYCRHCGADMGMKGADDE